MYAVWEKTAGESSSFHFPLFFYWRVCSDCIGGTGFFSTVFNHEGSGGFWDGLNTMKLGSYQQLFRSPLYVTAQLLKEYKVFLARQNSWFRKMGMGAKDENHLPYFWRKVGTDRFPLSKMWKGTCSGIRTGNKIGGKSCGLIDAVSTFQPVISIDICMRIYFSRNRQSLRRPHSLPSFHSATNFRPLTISRFRIRIFALLARSATNFSYQQLGKTAKVTKTQEERKFYTWKALWQGKKFLFHNTEGKKEAKREKLKSQPWNLLNFPSNKEEQPDSFLPLFSIFF